MHSRGLSRWRPSEAELRGRNRADASFGVSVPTLLLAVEQIAVAEAGAADQVAKRLARDGVAWDAALAAAGGCG